MKKEPAYFISSILGAVYGLLLILLSRCFILNLSKIFKIINLFLKLEPELAEHIYQVLEQLQRAELVFPWAIILLIAMCAGALYFRLVHRYRHKIYLSVCLMIIFQISLISGIVCFTEVNGVRLANFWIKTPTPYLHEINTYVSNGNSWNFGFGKRQIIPDEKNKQPLYIAGYNNGIEITNVLDYCEARAVWLDTGEDGALLIGIDCIALDSNTVGKIRDGLANLPKCASVNVYATHTHAGIDTLGMWGPIGIDGKNSSYMDKLIQAAIEAGRDAAANRTAGTLYYSQVKTDDMYRDSREPQVYDENLYQLRFSSYDSDNGLRLYFYGAHAESLRGNNKQLSRDFPGMLCDKITELTGDNTMFFPGAVGGLIMTKEFADTDIHAVENMEITADKLVDYALSISEKNEQILTPNLVLGSTKCVIPMDNTAFWLYKFLGILNNKAVPAESATGYGVETEMAILMLDDLAVTLLPGEIFPELVLGGEYGNISPENGNPTPLIQIANKYGIHKMLIVGLANDEIGYIVPPSDFMVNKEMPYIKKTMDYKGENHYEETNSIGLACANIIAETFDVILKELHASYF